jgi:U3 small nucleolar RNA-associated protein 11
MSLNKASKSQSKPYRERHQPQDRNHLGLLEKKKDYKLRADDYNNKKQVLKHLRKKALNKNPDEFYFHMTNSKTVDGGIHRDLVSEKTKSATANTTDQIRLMQTQDYKYVSMRRVMEQRKIEKLKGALHLLDADTTSTRPVNTHTVFVEDETEKRSLNLAKRFDTTQEMLGRTSNRPKLELLKAPEQTSRLSGLEVDESALKKKNKSYKQLSQRIERHKQLTIVEEKIKFRREIANKNKPAVILKEESATNPAIVRWKVERKR